MSNVRDVKNKLKYSNNINVNSNINVNNLKDSSNNSNNKNDSNSSVVFNYQLNELEITKEDLEYLLGSIINSKIDGTKLHFVFNLTLKLQYKLKLLEDKE